MKTCPDCKKQFEPQKSNGLAISKRCYKCLMKREREKKREQIKRQKERAKKKREAKKESKSSLIKQLDKVFSIYIRKRDADKNGFITCPCCDRKIHWKNAQNMHYNSRAKMNTRFCEKNCFAGCIGCNVFKNGAYPEYTEFILKKFGEKYLRDLIKSGRDIKQWTTSELKDLIQKYDKSNLV